MRHASADENRFAAHYFRITVDYVRYCVHSSSVPPFLRRYPVDPMVRLVGEVYGRRVTPDAYRDGVIRELAGSIAITSGLAKLEEVCLAVLRERMYLLGAEPQQTRDVGGRAVAEADPDHLRG